MMANDVHVSIKQPRSVSFVVSLTLWNKRAHLVFLLPLEGTNKAFKYLVKYSDSLSKASLTILM